MSAKAPPPRQARWWLTLPSERLSSLQRRFVEVLVRDSDRVRSAQRLAVAFGRVLRGRNAVALDEWLLEVEASEVVEFRDFVETLLHDAEAVRAAITSPWSNGQTEGQVNKIKTDVRPCERRSPPPATPRRMRHVSIRTAGDPVYGGHGHLGDASQRPRRGLRATAS